MATLTFFVAVFVALMAKEGALSCTLRNHRPECTDSTSTSHHKPASCVGSPFEHFPDALNTIASNASDSFSFSQKNPVPEPQVVPPLSPLDHHNLLLTNQLLSYLSFAPLESLQPPRSSYSSTTSVPLITTTPSPTLDHNDVAQLKQILSLLLSGSGSSLLSTPAPTVAAPPSIPVQTAMPAAVPVTGVPIAAPSANQKPDAVVTPVDVAAPPSVPNAVPAAPAAPALEPVAPSSYVPEYNPVGAASTPIAPAEPAPSVPASQPAAPPSSVLPAAVPAVPVSAPETIAAPKSTASSSTN